MIFAELYHVLDTIHRGSYILTYQAPYYYYESKAQLSTQNRELVAYFANALVCTLIYIMRGGGSAKTLFAAFLQLFYKTYSSQLARFDRHNSVLVLQAALVLCILEITQHGERQRLSLSILN